MKPPCLCTGRSDVVCTGDECSIQGPGEPGNPNQCRPCWLRLEGKGPGSVQMATNAVAALAQHLVAGGKLVSDAVKLDRLAVCAGCSVFDPVTRRCKDAGCGCYLDIKAGWAEQHCPRDKWKE